MEQKQTTDISVVGSCNYDMFSYVKSFPAPGETIFGKEFSTGFGGKGANQAVCASILGARVALLSRVGDDAFGKDYLEHLKAKNIDISFIERDDSNSTGVAVITVDETSENHIVVTPGANQKVSKKQLQSFLCSNTFLTSKFLICQNEINFDATLESLKAGKENNIKTIFNPSPMQDFPSEIFSLIDILVVNQTELSQILTSLSVEYTKPIEQNLLSTCKNLLNSTQIKAIVVTLGSKGAFYLSGETSDFVPSVKVENVIDSTGAGDCFLAAFAVSLVQQEKEELIFDVAVKKAVQVSAESVQHAGCQTSYEYLSPLM
eukprot:maker-scaffold_11-snap-gene-12.16-mRNA-1 protein AED:0.00 eAED:0.00 QI:239/1/1/1/1/1/3/80/317